MNYQQIKLELSKARRLVSDGKLAEADGVVRALVDGGSGVTLHDISENLGREALAKLRAYSKGANR